MSYISVTIAAVVAVALTLSLVAVELQACWVYAAAQLGAQGELDVNGNDIETR